MSIDETLIKHIKDCNDKLIAVDLDGTLCHGEWWGPEHVDPEPDTEMVEFIWDLYRRGAHIIIYTARQPKHYPQTHGWLIKHGIPFHGICMFIKPGADVYIDDKSIHPSSIKNDKTKD